jgi:hypothetical protein
VVQDERGELIQELTRCIREPFFVFVVSFAFQPGDYLSGVAVLDLEKPLAVKEVVVGLRCHAKVWGACQPFPWTCMCTGSPHAWTASCTSQKHDWLVLRCCDC